MNHHQTVDMRTTGAPVIFGDTETHRRWQQQCRAIRATLKAGQYVVAPLATVETRGGRLLRELEPITIDMMHNPARAAAELDELIRAGRVLAALE